MSVSITRTTRVIHCSQCGQEGHNRRSRLCPRNVVGAAQLDDDDDDVPIPLVAPENPPSIYDAVVSNVDRITDYISRWECRDLNTSQFISLVKPTVTWVCFYMTAALSQGVDCSRVLTHFNNDVISINRIVHRYRRQEFYIRLDISQNSVVPRFVYRADTQLANTNAQSNRLNAISVVTSTVLSCDCPICLESVDDTAAIYTNCSHGFCVDCIKGLATSIKNNGLNQTPACPMCRQEITQLKASLDVCTEFKNHLSAL